jgi:Domain of Unknown Function (DUF1080).
MMTILRFLVLLAGSSALLVPSVHAAETVSEKATASPEKNEVITPTETIQLLNGKDLSNFYTWIQDTGYEDPRKVFTIQPDGILRVSGEGYGGLITRKEYANYYLILEYRWGTETHLNRKERARDGGLLLHCQGPDGNFGGRDGKPGPWMNSIECQVIEGGVGDILVLPGKDADGNVLPASATAKVVRDAKGAPYWDPNGKEETFTSGRINWFGRDPEWKDVLGFRGPKDVDSPGQEWTRVECIMDGDSLTYLVNGVVVNRATKVFPNHGKIFLQTECAEMFVRKLELHPLKK